MAQREAVLAWCNAALEPERFKDYGPNGLQVQGKPTIQRVMSGVTASRALIEQAIEWQADAVLVHHGLFWRGQSGAITGWLRERLALLLRHDINLLAYHLPLDAHAQWGNNAQLGVQLGLAVEGRFGDQNLGVWASTPDWSWAHLLSHCEQVLGRPPVAVPGDGRVIRRLGWCTGGAQGYFESAMEAGVDAFLTGEISEPQAHLARESGVAFLACGHHATERYGAPALGQALSDALGLTHRFVDLDNPA